MAMEIEKLRELAESFFEWPTEDRSHVTLTSALLFAQHVLRATQQAGEPVGWHVTYTNGFDFMTDDIDELDDVAEVESIVPLYTAPRPEPVQEQEHQATSNYTAADMASQAAQGFRDGVESVNKQPAKPAPGGSDD